MVRLPRRVINCEPIALLLLKYRRLRAKKRGERICVTHVSGSNGPSHETLVLRSCFTMGGDLRISSGS